MRRHLIGVVMAAMSVPLIAFLIPLLVLLSRDGQHRALEAATRRANEIVPLVGRLTERSLPAQAEEGFEISVVRPDGGVIGVPTALTPSIESARRCVGSTARTADGVEVVVPAAGTGGCGTVVRVLARGRALDGGSSVVTFLVLTLSGALLLAGVLLAERLAGGLLHAVDDLAMTADRMATGDLTARVSPDGPTAVRRVGEQLNRLAIRVDLLMDEQRRRAADLTHRLRTPLTALRLDIEAVRHPAAQRLIADYDAVTKAVNDAIRLARRSATDESLERSDLIPAVRDRVEFWSALADDTGRSVVARIDPGPLPVRASRAAIEATLDALLGNIFAHTANGVPFWVTAQPVHGGGGDLTVDDAGPGFPDLDVVRRGRSSGSSTGLGLDIARRTAEDSGGWLRLGRSPQGGSRIELRFGGPE